MPRFPTYLHLAPSGVWHFRARIGGHIHKRSLATRDTLTAQRLALSWVYALRMPKTLNIDDIVRSFKRGELSDLTVKGVSLPNGTKVESVEINNDEDQQRWREFMATTGGGLAWARDEAPVAEKVSVGKASTAWLLAILSETLPKTITQKRAAVESFAEHFGRGRYVAEVDRPAVAGWLDSLRIGGLSAPTIVNKASYVRGFLDWCRGRGWIHFPKGENPAAGIIKFGKREKRRRRGLGFRAFTDDQIATLYSPEAVARLRPDARWGVVLGLYTGARVSEIGQLALDDFVEVEGIPCFRITDEGAGQSLKTDASRRTIPIHSDLLTLGLMKHVDALRTAGKRKLFSKVSDTVINGQGQWLSKAFSYHLRAMKVSVDKGRVGFHSLRSTMVHKLQDAKVVDEVRAAIVGHELDDEHHQAYSRAITPAEMLVDLRRVSFGLDLKAIGDLLR